MEFWAAVFLFAVGFVMSVLIPTWQTPDEETHVKAFSKAIRNDSFYENLIEELNPSGENVVMDADERTSLSDQLQLITKKPGYTRLEMMPRGITVGIIKYLPIVCGLMIGILLGLPAYWVLQLAEWAGLVFYAVACYYALKKMPFKKEVLFLIMALPMSLQQAGSVGYDSVVLSLSYLFLAYLLYLKFDSETIGTKELVLSLFFLGILSYTKVVYVLFGLLYLLLPMDKIHIRIGRFEINKAWIKKYGLIAAVLGVGCLVAGVYYFRHNVFVQVLWGLVTERERSWYLFQQTMEIFHEYLLDSVIGNLGWLDAQLATWCVIFVYICLFSFAIAAGNVKGKTFSVIETIYIYLVFIVMFLMIFASMVNHTITMTLYGVESDAAYNIHEALYQIPFIGGFQGRYFLPFFPLLFLPMRSGARIKENYVAAALICVEAVVLFCTVQVLLNRYWIG